MVVNVLSVEGALKNSHLPLSYRKTTVTSTERKQLAQHQSNSAAGRAGLLQSWPRVSALINTLTSLLLSFFPSEGRLHHPRVTL